MRIKSDLLLACAGVVVATITAVSTATAVGSVPIPTPTYDPLATPVLSENPTTQELGANVYYYHCMPCHGDVGQGLTDAFRSVWEEDHQNCWGRGCHGGRSQDEGFPIPTVVPAVMATGDALPAFHTPQQLFDYLETTHPPQAPGRLSDEDTWALVALLWEGNGKPTPSETPPPPTATPPATPTPQATPTAPPAPDRAPLSVCGVELLTPASVIIFTAFRRKRNTLNN